MLNMKCMFLTFTTLACMALTVSARSIEAIATDLATRPGDTALAHELKGRIGEETEPTRKVHFGVIYALACGYAGDLDEAKQVVGYIKENFPEASDLQYITTDYIGDPCAGCDGTGKTPVPCRKCKGAGRCHQCKGQGHGRITGIDGSAVQCLVCKGEGSCPACEGTGSTDYGCLTCSGTGTIISKSRIKQTLTLLVSEHEETTDDAGEANGGALRLEALLTMLSASATEYDRQTSASAKQEIADSAISAMRARVDGALMTATATIKDVRRISSSVSLVTVTGIKEAALPRGSSEGLTLYNGRRIRLRMSATQAKTVNPGHTITLTGDAVYVTQQAAAGDQPFLAIRMGKASVPVGSITMDRYVATINGQVYASPAGTPRMR